MNVILYVFTGTGNSLAAAEYLASVMGNTRIESIPQLMKIDGPVIPDTGKIGIIFPVNYSGVPAMVTEFVSKLSLDSVRYCFGICTSGGVGRYSLVQLDNLLKENGGHLSAGWMVHMVDNYIPYGGAPDDKKQNELLEKTNHRLDRIVYSVLSERNEKPRITLITGLLHLLFYKRFIKSLSTIDDRFRVDTSCNGCRTCIRVCPAENIQLRNNRPEWMHHCTFCLACINLCPREAIQLEEKTRKNRRYHNPQIPLKKLMEFQGHGEQE